MACWRAPTDIRIVLILVTFGFSGCGQVLMRSADGGMDSAPPDDSASPRVGCVSQVSAGAFHTCARRSDGTLWCWGLNGVGQIGNGLSGPNETETRPLQVERDADWKSVTSGDFETCGIRQDGRLFCWGGLQLNPPSPLTPKQRSTASPWTSVAIGNNHSCGTVGLSVVCWGNGGELGTVSQEGTEEPTFVMNGTWQIAVGSAHELSHTCAAGGSLLCWGYNDDGRLGTGSTDESQHVATPTHVGTDADWQSVVAGLSHTCGIRDNGLYCWGRNTKGEVGDGGFENRISPTRIGDARDWSSISSYASFTCGIRDPGTLWCWGETPSSGFGISRVPTQVGRETDWKRVSVGAYHVCAIRQSGELFCWGNNESGQLGDGTKQTAYEPILTSLPCPSL